MSKPSDPSGDFRTRIPEPRWQQALSVVLALIFVAWLGWQIFVIFSL